MIALNINEPVKAILLDIEGTTTPIDFVYQVLFPYAHHHFRDYLIRHLSNDEVQSDIKSLRNEHTADVVQGHDPPVLDANSTESLIETSVAYVHWLMDQDRKSTPLKSLQGKIWEAGYRAGELKSDLFADVPRSMKRWNGQNRRVCIYSSGSALAQRLLFAHTEYGDLTSLIDGYFDTRIGMKQEASSYQRIAEALQIASSEMLFISDVTAELAAARTAGAQTLLAIRPGNKLQPHADLYSQVTTFDAIFA